MNIALMMLFSNTHTKHLSTYIVDTQGYFSFFQNFLQVEEYTKNGDFKTLLLTLGRLQQELIKRMEFCQENKISSYNWQQLLLIIPEYDSILKTIPSYLSDKQSQSP